LFEIFNRMPLPGRLFHSPHYQSQRDVPAESIPVGCWSFSSEFPRHKAACFSPLLVDEFVLDRSSLNVFRWESPRFMIICFINAELES